MTRKPFPKKSESKTDEILDLIHTDVCGPMQTTTPGEKRYFMTMIDDSSRYTEVYLLGQKSEVPEKIKVYVRHVQTKFGKTPKKIRSDRGGEYTAERLQTFLKDEGIQAEHTTPYTPQQNGCAERKNRSLVEMTRCIYGRRLLRKSRGDKNRFSLYREIVLKIAKNSFTVVIVDKGLCNVSAVRFCQEIMNGHDRS